MATDGHRIPDSLSRARLSDLHPGLSPNHSGKYKIHGISPEESDGN